MYQDMDFVRDSATSFQWDKLQQLCHQLRSQFPDRDASRLNEEFDRRTESERTRLIAVLKGLLLRVIAGLKSDTRFQMQFVRRNHWPNVYFDPKSGLRLVEQPEMTLVSGQRLHRVAHMLLLLLRLLNSGDRATKRDHMYAVEFQSLQCQVDDIIDDIAATCRISRLSLNTISSSEGLIFGDVQYTTRAGDRFHCLNSVNQPTGIMTACTDIRRMSSPAAFVLVVEKDTVFRRLLAHAVPVRMNCILVTGKGYPDLPSRRMVHQLWHFLRIPILALVDGDPHGVEIMCMYRFGSLSAAYDCDSLSCPQMRWIGFLPSDFAHNSATRTPLTPADVKKLQDLLTRPYVQHMPELNDQLVRLGAGGHKHGLDRFADLRTDYISYNYLPKCLSRGRFV